MKHRVLLVGLAVACLCAGAFAALLATDVRAWQSALRADDAAAVARPAQAMPRGADETLPFHVARDLLGLRDDLELRRALVLFHAGYTGVPSADQSTAGAAARAGAEAALERFAAGEADARRASAAANLLGVLELVDAAIAEVGNGASVGRAIVELQNAIRLDPANDDAKANLELAMAQAPPDSPFRASRLGSHGKRRGGASESSPGRGY
jgi:hypothetical protein